MVDTAIPAAVVHACIGAAGEVGATVVLTSSSASREELAADAAQTHCLQYSLPGGPRQLRRVLDRALQSRSAPRWLDGRGGDVTSALLHPAVRAAVAGVARARMHVNRAAGAAHGAATRQIVPPGVASDMERCRGAMRAAVADLASQFRRSQVAEDAAVETVCDIVTDCAILMGVGDALDSLLTDTERWVRSAYQEAPARLEESPQLAQRPGRPASP